MKKRIIQVLLYTGVVTTIALAQQFPQTPKQETLAEAIRFEKYKLAAAEAQARKDAGESVSAKSSATNKARKRVQADRSQTVKPAPAPTK